MIVFGLVLALLYPYLLKDYHDLKCLSKMFKQQITIKYQYVNDLYICVYTYIYVYIHMYIYIYYRPLNSMFSMFIHQ